MKLIQILFLLSVLITSTVLGEEFKLTVTVNNPSDLGRTGETVSISWDQLRAEAPWLNPAKVAVTDSREKRLPTQSIGDEFLFQSDFSPRETKIFVLSNDPSHCADTVSVTDVKYVLPRKDITWENDRIAHRIYGSPLAGDVLSGIDVWVKRVRHHVIDNWYAGISLEGKARISYHADHGEGADFFTVGRSLGAGGCAIWKDSLYHQTGLFKSHEIIATGPIRLKFIVDYDGDSINGKPFRERKTYTMDAGSNLTRIDVSYSGLDEKGDLLIASGLVKRKDAVSHSDEKLGVLSLWGSTNDDTANGWTGTGVVMPENYFHGFKEDRDHYLILGKSSTSNGLTYYAGAGWTRSGDFNSEEEWQRYLKNFSKLLRSPLKITLSATEPAGKK